MSVSEQVMLVYLYSPWEELGSLTEQLLQNMSKGGQMNHILQVPTSAPRLTGFLQDLFLFAGYISDFPSTSTQELDLNNTGETKPTLS